MKLKELRILKKLRQSDIAEMLNITTVAYNRYEKGIREPNIATLIKLADFYNVTLDYLVDRPFSNEFGYLSDEEKEIILAYRQMNPSNQSKYQSEAKGILLAQK